MYVKGEVTLGRQENGREERRLTRCSQRQQWKRREAPYKMFSKTAVVKKRGALQDVLKDSSGKEERRLTRCSQRQQW